MPLCIIINRMSILMLIIIQKLHLKTIVNLIHFNPFQEFHCRREKNTMSSLQKMLLWKNYITCQNIKYWKQNWKLAIWKICNIGCTKILFKHRKFNIFWISKNQTEVRTLKIILKHKQKNNYKWKNQCKPKQTNFNNECKGSVVLHLYSNNFSLMCWGSEQLNLVLNPFSFIHSFIGGFFFSAKMRCSKSGRRCCALFWMLESLEKNRFFFFNFVSVLFTYNFIFFYS